MSSIFDTTIEKYDFTQDGIKDIKETSKGEDWPVVYILNGDKEAYVGETQNAFARMSQHFATKSTLRKNLTTINLMKSDSFNKSAILDIENMLISHMHADGKFVLQNANGGQSKLHNYYQRVEYQNAFNEIWNTLKKLDLVNHNLYEVENMDIFKYSPYKELTKEQYQVVESLLELYSKAIQGNDRIDVMVKGGAGTGKTLIAIYFMNVIADILSNGYDFSDVEDDDSFFNKKELIKTIKRFGNNKIGFVVPVPSFKGTISKVFKSIKELKNFDIVSPAEASKKEYDVLIVDEAHRLKRRNKLTNYSAFDNVNKSLDLPMESTELDWVKFRAKKMLLLFYDNHQSVKESDVMPHDFDDIAKHSKVLELCSQLRVKGGNEYINFVYNLFVSPSKYQITNGYDVKVYDDCSEMLNDIKKKNIEYNGLCRVLSGISFPWRNKMRRKLSNQLHMDYDFEIDGRKYSWNTDFNAVDYITNDENIEKIGCVYTSQGHDLNYAGVIFGKDVSYNPTTGKIEFHVKEFNDRNSITKDESKTIHNIISHYSILLTRGVYGTYLYAVDKNLREYLKSLLLHKGD